MSAIIIAVLKLSGLDDIPKGPSKPSPPWKDPGFEIPFLPPFSPKENAARGRTKERLAIREKRGAKRGAIKGERKLPNRIFACGR